MIENFLFIKFAKRNFWYLLTNFIIIKHNFRKIVANQLLAPSQKILQSFMVTCLLTKLDLQGQTLLYQFKNFIATIIKLCYPIQLDGVCNHAFSFIYLFSLFYYSPVCQLNKFYLINAL